MDIHDSREIRVVVGRSIFNRVKSCAFLVYWDHDKRFPSGGQGAVLTKEDECDEKQY